MSEIYQVCYVSSATARHPEIFDDLRNIISEARHFNYQHQITGALCYANYYFFQCLEGAASDIEQVTALIKKDPRHFNLRFSKQICIEQRSFNDWSMKFVGRQSQVQQVLNALGYADFSQLQFESKELNQILDNSIAAQSEELVETH